MNLRAPEFDDLYVPESRSRRAFDVDAHYLECQESSDDLRCMFEVPVVQARDPLTVRSVGEDGYRKEMGSLGHSISKMVV